MVHVLQQISLFFFFNDTATTEIYTLSLHDALPISGRRRRVRRWAGGARGQGGVGPTVVLDRKSTRLNSSHSQISYAVFCLKKKTRRGFVRSQGGDARTYLASLPHTVLTVCLHACRR